MAKLPRVCFAGENKSTVTRHLHDLNANPNPLETLEQGVNHKDYTRREVGFCAQWCLDNLCKYGFRVNPTVHCAQYCLDNLCKYEPKSYNEQSLTASNFLTLIFSTWYYSECVHCFIYKLMMFMFLYLIV